jgi:glycosyltransferase involved in cell wall biosynthesis
VPQDLHLGVDRGSADAAGIPTVWVLPDGSAPLRHVLAEYRDRVGPADVRYWGTAAEGARPYGRTLSLPRVGTGYPLSIKVIRPRLALDLWRHPAQVVVALEIDLAVLYALVTKLRRRERRVITLVEGDLAQLGPTGSARWKMWFRRALVRWIDGFVANSDQAVRYLREDLGVPDDRITRGWWLAGLPDDVPAVAPHPVLLAARRGPTFATVGQLIPRKGHAALIRAVAAYRDRHGECQLWIIGEGPERAALQALAAGLGMGDRVVLLGHLDRPQLRGALESADVFVFPTFSDLIGRALVEAVSVGLPVVVSSRSGAIGTLLHDGVDCVVVDPEDPEDLLRGLAVAADPAALSALAEGAARAAAIVDVGAAARVVAAGVAAAVARRTSP